MIFVEDMPCAPASPDGDWAAAFQQAAEYHLQELVVSDDPLRFQRTWIGEPIMVGRDHVRYRCHSPIHCFGAWFVGKTSQVVVSFDAGTDGFIAHYPDTINGTLPGTYHDDSGSRFEGFGGRLRLHGLTVQGSATGVGVRVYNGVDVHACTVSGFGVNIRVSADARRQDDPADPSGLDQGASNANLGVIRQTNVFSATSHGVELAGGDSNWLLLEHLNIAANAGNGLHNESFLGVMCDNLHFANNGVDGGYDIWSKGRNARTLFLNPYIEGPQGRAAIEAPALIVGGIGGDYSETTAPRWRGDTLVAPLYFGHFSDSASQYRTQMYESADSDVVTYSSKNAGRSVLREKYYVTQQGSRRAGWYSRDERNVNSRVVDMISTDAATTPNGSKAIPGRMAWPQGHYMGPQYAFVQYDDLSRIADWQAYSPPVLPPEGAFQHGSVVINTVPDEGLPFGAVFCVDEVWRPYGFIGGDGSP